MVGKYSFRGIDSSFTMLTGDTGSHPWAEQATSAALEGVGYVTASFDSEEPIVIWRYRAFEGEIRDDDARPGFMFWLEPRP